MRNNTASPVLSPTELSKRDSLYTTTADTPAEGTRYVFSRMVTGKKRWLLRPFDGLFRRQGATEFPIHIRGSVKDPEFGVDVKETLKRALIPGR